MRICGASVWEQDLYDLATAHAEHEREVLQSYQELAESPVLPRIACPRAALLTPGSGDAGNLCARWSAHHSGKWHAARRSCPDSASEAP